MPEVTHHIETYPSAALAQEGADRCNGVAARLGYSAAGFRFEAQPAPIGFGRWCWSLALIAPESLGLQEQRVWAWRARGPLQGCG